MKVGQYCTRAVKCISATQDVLDAARRMRDEHVGFLVVHEDGDPFRRPIGVLTDRDIVLQIIARQVDPASVAVQDVMSREPLVANETDDLNELMEAMRLVGVRRAPVVDQRGALTGVIAADDVVDVIAGLMCDLAGSIKSEQRQEWRARGTSAAERPLF